MTNSTRKMKNSILAMPAAPGDAASQIAAMMAMMKKWPSRIFGLRFELMHTH